MYYPGQLIKINPKLATLDSGDYYNTSGLRVANNEASPSWREITYFNPEMVHLAGTAQRVLSWDKETGTIRISRRGTSDLHWTLIPDWILPPQTFKEL